MADRLQELERRFAAEPTSRIFLQLAEEYRRLGARDKALVVLEQGMKHNGAWLAAQVALGRCLAETGRHADAARALEGVVRRDPTQLVAYRLLVECYLAVGDLPVAEERLTIYRQLNPQDPVIVQLEQRLRRGDGVTAARPMSTLPPPRATPRADDTPTFVPPPPIELPPLPAIAPPSSAAPAPVPHVPWPDLSLGEPVEPEHTEEAPLEWFATSPNRVEPPPPTRVAPPPPLAVSARGELKPPALVAPEAPHAPAWSGPPLLEPAAFEPERAAAPQDVALPAPPNEPLPAAGPAADEEQTLTMPLSQLAAATRAGGAGHSPSHSRAAAFDVASFDLPRPDLGGLYRLSCRSLSPPLGSPARLRDGVVAALAATSEEPPLAGDDASTVTLGLLYLEQGHLEEARATIERVLERQPDDTSARRALAEIERRALSFELEPPAVPEFEHGPLPPADDVSYADGFDFPAEPADAPAGTARGFAAPAAGPPLPSLAELAPSRPLGLSERKALMLRDYLQRVRANAAPDAR